ncbi:MAG: hypothetical protein HZY75_05265 [Nocardioidaceae bacterium]|nr:MAG: hypothetical protein HZY75_05265 [Nocardioidaceae bacterium]
MILPFPVPGRQVQLAYRELNLAVNGTEEEKKQIGNPALLPRPWEPASCLESELRLQVWRWLEDVVAWLNHEYSWDIAGAIPTCWPMHPHLIHDLAVVADQRRRAGLAMTSDALEEWHRYCLPAFVDRIRSRLKAHCDDEHSPWPGRSRHAQHLSDTGVHSREQAYTGDIEALCNRTRTVPAPRPAPRLGLVDLETGEVRDLNQNLGEISDPDDRDH